MRRTHFNLLATLVAVAVLSIPAFAGEKVFVYGTTVEPRTIDPVINTAVDGSQLIYNMFEGLLRTNFEDKAEPGCAESWDVSEDHLTWTFHLRPGLKWHDGSPLTAEHFRYGFLRVVDPEVASPNAYLAYAIKNAEKFYRGECSADDVGVTALDDRTLRVELEYFDPLMEDHMAFHAFVPAKPEVVEANPRSWAASPETIICNGPFYLSGWSHNAEIIMTKNPYYWDADNVKIDGVRNVIIPDANTMLAAFRSGRVDFFKNPPSILKASLLASGEAKTVNTLGVNFSVFNVNEPPFDDVRVRKAFALAIDRELITKKVTMAGEIPATGYIPAKVPGPSTAKDFRSAGKVWFGPNADVAEAKRLLAEAGYPDAKDFPHVTYKYNSSDVNKALAEALQGMWKQNLGIEVELYTEEWKVFISTRRMGNFQLARHGDMVDFPDPSSLMDKWVTGTVDNVAGYNNPEYDRLVIAARSEPDHDKRMGYFLKAEELLMNDMVVIPICYYATPYMVSDRVRGMYTSPRNRDNFRHIELVE